MPGLGALFHEALVFAADSHGDQRRMGTDVPYVSHLLGVCALVLESEGDETEAIAALLHDAIEDGKARPEEVERRFGPVVLRIVAECSDPLPASIPWIERKRAYIAHLPDASPPAIRVSIADKLENARAILFDYRLHGESVWNRLADPNQLWYYGELASAFRRREDEPGLEWLPPYVDELERVVAELRRQIELTSGRPNA